MKTVKHSVVVCLLESETRPGFFVTCHQNSSPRYGMEELDREHAPYHENVAQCSLKNLEKHVFNIKSHLRPQGIDDNIKPVKYNFDVIINFADNGKDVVSVDRNYTKVVDN